MRGADLKELKERLGNKTMTMTVICTLKPGAQEKAVGLLNGLTGYVKSDMSQNITNSDSAKLQVAN